MVQLYQRIQNSGGKFSLKLFYVLEHFFAEKFQQKFQQKFQRNFSKISKKFQRNVNPISMILRYQLKNSLSLKFQPIFYFAEMF